MSNAHLTLQRFSGELEACLETMSHDELRERLLHHARGLPPAERTPFLAIFSTPRTTVRTSSASVCVSLVEVVEDDPLLDEIDEFVDRLRAGDYVHGFGWDPEIRDQRAFGDEGWVWEMDGFLDAADRAFTSGRLGLARAAYERLLGAFALDGEVGAFCGALPPTEMISTDLGEAQARYLRSVYETTAPEERAEALAGAWFGLPSIDLPTLTEVREARVDDLAELDEFLPRWIGALRSFGAGRRGTRSLLREATQMAGGVDALATLAREPGAGQAERYLDWVEALRGAGRVADAQDAAHEGRMVATGEPCARLAEHVADLAGDDADARLDARVAAWRAAPTQARLLAVVGDARAASREQAVLSTEADALVAGALPTVTPRLAATLMLLAGRLDEAVAAVEAPDRASSAYPAGAVVVPYLLAASCAAVARPEWSTTRLAALLRGVDDEMWSGWTSRVGRAGQVEPSDPGSLSALLTERLAAATDPPEVRQRYLDAVTAVNTADVERIVGAKQRSRYEEVARLVVCLAEAQTLEHGEAVGAATVTSVVARYPRHVAFRDAVIKAAGVSSVLGPSPGRRRR